MAPCEPGFSRYRSFTIKLRHTTAGRTLLDEWSARRRVLYLTTQNSQNRQKWMPPTRFEPAIPASGRSQSHDIDSSVTGIDRQLVMPQWRNYNVVFPTNDRGPTCQTSSMNFNIVQSTMLCFSNRSKACFCVIIWQWSRTDVNVLIWFSMGSLGLSFCGRILV
jgi:hypothetical protein